VRASFRQVGSPGWDTLRKLRSARGVYGHGVLGTPHSNADDDWWLQAVPLQAETQKGHVADRATTQLWEAEIAGKEGWLSPPGYVTIAKTKRPERPWEVCGLFEDVYEASDAAGSLYGVSTVVCRLVPISRRGDGKTRICSLCGELFRPVRYNQVYCNPGCRTEARTARRKTGRRRRRSQARQ
jgi:hypothetical protein